MNDAYDRFDPHNYPPAVARLLEGERLVKLGPGVPDARWRSELEMLDNERLFGGQPVADVQMAEACRAGLWLLHDWLEPSHRISQTIPTATGSYWHAIMHRREPDFPNAKYWLQRVGQHPVFEPLGVAAGELATRFDAAGPAGFLRAHDRWDPFAFVDLCQAALGGANACEELCRWIARREWELLFDYSYRHALGRGRQSD